MFTPAGMDRNGWPESIGIRCRIAPEFASGASAWEFARILVRKGQRLQVPFETAIKAENGGFLEPSKKEMCTYLDKKEKLAGSLFGKINSSDFGENEDLNIDKLIEKINKVL